MRTSKYCILMIIGLLFSQVALGVFMATDPNGFATDLINWMIAKED